MSKLTRKIEWELPSKRQGGNFQLLRRTLREFSRGNFDSAMLHGHSATPSRCGIDISLSGCREIDPNCFQIEGTEKRQGETFDSPVACPRHFREEILTLRHSQGTRKRPRSAKTAPLCCSSWRRARQGKFYSGFTHYTSHCGHSWARSGRGRGSAQRTNSAANACYGHGAVLPSRF